MCGIVRPTRSQPVGLPYHAGGLPRHPSRKGLQLHGRAAVGARMVQSGQYCVETVFFLRSLSAISISIRDLDSGGVSNAYNISFLQQSNLNKYGIPRTRNGAKTHDEACRPWVKLEEVQRQLGSSRVPFVLFVFWSKLGFADNELICMSILCTRVPLLNKHSSIDRFRTIRESTSFPFSPCSSTRTIAGEKPGDGRTLHLTWVANLVWIAIPWSLTGYL